MQQVNERCLVVSAISLSFLIHLALSAYLLASNRYFDLTSKQWEATCGLLTLSKDDISMSYAEYRARCVPASDSLCRYIPSLEAGGLSLFWLLCVSTVLEAANLAQAWATRLLLTKAIRTLLSDQPTVPISLKLASALLKVALIAGLLDPVVLLAGIVVWTVEGDLGGLGGEFRVEAGIGLIALVAKTAVSMAVSAGQIVSLLSTKRRNQELLIGRLKEGGKVSDTQGVSTIAVS